MEEDATAVDGNKINFSRLKRYLAENCKEVVKRKLLYPKLCDTSSTFRGLYFHKSKPRKQRKHLRIAFAIAGNKTFQHCPEEGNQIFQHCDKTCEQLNKKI